MCGSSRISDARRAVLSASPPPCACGQQGCIEAHARGRALALHADMPAAAFAAAATSPFLRALRIRGRLLDVGVAPHPAVGAALVPEQEPHG